MNERPVTETSVVIIGASAAGLATAACLKRQGVDYLLLEQGQQVGDHLARHVGEETGERDHPHVARERGEAGFRRGGC